MFSWYGRFMFAPDTGADGGTVARETTSEVDNTDYKALYEREVAERAKLKKSFDATASEIAELKKQNKAKMSEEEKRDAELAEERERWKEMANELNEIKVANVFARQGFDERDYSELSKKLVSVCGNSAYELAETFVEFVKKANKSAVASAKNGMIKDGSIPPNASSAQADAQSSKSDFQNYQESKTKTNNIVKL